MNNSTNTTISKNVTLTGVLLAKEYKNSVILQNVVMSLFSAFGIFGNILILIIGVRRLAKYFRIPKVASSQDCKISLIANLAIADILTLVQGVPMHLVLENRLPITDFICRYLSPVKDILWYVSLLTIMAISIERAVAVINPFALKMTQRHTRYGIILIWITAYLCGGVPMIFALKSNRHYWCVVQYSSDMLRILHRSMAIVITVVPGIITTICYMLCWRSLYKFRQRHKRVINEMNSEANFEQWAFIEQSRSVSRIAVMLIIVFWFCNLPLLIYGICHVMKVLQLNETLNFYVRAVLLCIFFSVSAINPVVLIVMSPVYRRGAGAFLNKCFSKRKAIFRYNRSRRSQSLSRQQTSKSDQTVIAMGCLIDPAAKV